MGGSGSVEGGDRVTRAYPVGRRAEQCRQSSSPLAASAEGWWRTTSAAVDQLRSVSEVRRLITDGHRLDDAMGWDNACALHGADGSLVDLAGHRCAGRLAQAACTVGRYPTDWLTARAATQETQRQRQHTRRAATSGHHASPRPVRPRPPPSTRSRSTTTAAQRHPYLPS